MPDLGGGRHEEGLDAGELAVHLGHLQLVLEVADGAQALHDHRDVVRLAVVDEQALEAVDPDVGQFGDGVAQQLHALVDREEPGLARVDQHRHDQFVVQPGSTIDDVDVAVGDRVERTGTDGASHGKRPYRSTASPYRRSRSPSRGVGHANGSSRLERSTTSTAPGASQPPRCSAPRTSSTSETGVAYGGSASTTSKVSRARPATTAGTDPATTRPPGSPTTARLARSTGSTFEDDSTKTTRSAPRESASRPSAPDPA